MSLFDEAETECKKEEIKEEVTEETNTVPYHTRKKKRGGDMIMKDLPVEEVVHKVEDRVCNKCGTEMKPIGVEFLHDELVYVPAKMYRRRHSVETVKCPCCGKKKMKMSKTKKTTRSSFAKEMPLK